MNSIAFSCIVSLDITMATIIIVSIALLQFTDITSFAVSKIFAWVHTQNFFISNMNKHYLEKNVCKKYRCSTVLIMLCRCGSYARI